MNTTKKYIPKDIEPKWQQFWESSDLYATKSGTSKTYVLGMFPYPSGAGLHVGHVRIYTATDVLARYYRMQGKSVLYPMGWDAFGLPTENYAIKTGIKPQEATTQNIATFKSQMQSLGFSYDWKKEVNTTDPNYYKWTQWLFQQIYKEGLVYRKSIPMNWCPKCLTGLADEEVLADGRHERCGTPVEKREMPQWIMKITAYADRLLTDLEGLDWPEGILEMQRNWIGKSEGTEIEFAVNDSSFAEASADKQESRIKVFTTRADTLFGVTAIVVAPEHQLVKDLLSGSAINDSGVVENVSEYVKSASRKSEMERTQLEKEKTGVFTGIYASHPITGEKLPVWVADYVIGWYGHGAVMLVPAHDTRDFAFAEKYSLPLVEVIATKNTAGESELTKATTEYGTLVSSGEFTGQTSQEAITNISEYLEINKKGSKKVTFKLRDWIFSRQRYWGEPFPFVYCATCGDENGVVLIPEDQLPITLPDVQRYEPTDNGQSPLSTMKEWVNTTCPTCGGPATRETDTMPNWAGSSWYFLAFARNAELNKDIIPNLGNWKLEIGDSAERWMPVDWYLGGAEHAVLHLLYARFWQKVFVDRGMTNIIEPFARLRRVGIVGGPDGRKMSKSFGNVINPDDVVREFGADTLRVYEMFMGPWSQDLPWDTHGVYGSYRFLKRVWDLQGKLAVSSEELEGRTNVSSDDLSIMHRTIKKVGEDIAELKFNTAIASLMEWLNALSKKEKVSTQEYEVMVLLLASFAPHMAEELWTSVLAHTDSVHSQSWPVVNETYLIEDSCSIAVQVNGKVRVVITVGSKESTDEAAVRQIAQSNTRVSEYISDKEIRKVIYVPGKILNFVVS